MNSKVLLIVDDSQTTRQMLRSRFQRSRPDWAIYESDNGTDTILLASSIRPNFITMDVNMPHMSGLEAAEQILSRFPTLRLALVTANIQDATAKKAHDLGAEFIEKPIDDSSIDKIISFFEV